MNIDNSIDTYDTTLKKSFESEYGHCSMAKSLDLVNIYSFDLDLNSNNDFLDGFKFGSYANHFKLDMLSALLFLLFYFSISTFC